MNATKCSTLHDLGSAYRETVLRGSLNEYSYKGKRLAKNVPTWQELTAGRMSDKLPKYFSRKGIQV